MQGVSSKQLASWLCSAASVAAVLATSASCRQVVGELSNLPCDAGRCIAPYVCHPELELCVPPVPVGCERSDAFCPVTTQTGDECPSEGAYLPCAEGVTRCDGGCRTCGADHRWGECTPARCEVGSPWSCSACDDDCVDGVMNARAVCSLTGSVYACDYEGSCRAGAVDVDGVRSNGCECAISHGAVERCDGVDNDCDGRIDDGFACRAGDFGLCDAGHGPASGVRTCADDCGWDTCNPGWRRRMKLSFHNGGGLHALDDFPLLVVLDPARFAYGEAAADGSDLRFLDADGVTLLAHELEQWNPGGASFIWVRVPRIDAGSTADHVYLYYGSDSPLPPPPSASDVWDGEFLAVWHLGEEQPGVGNAQVYRDSSGAGLHGGDDVTLPAIAGAAGRAQAFDRGDRIALPDVALTAPFTLELWVQPEAATWGFKRALSVSPATPIDDLQVELHLEGTSFDYVRTSPSGADLRFYDLAHNPLPHWVERWMPNGVSTLWVRAGAAGTAGMLMYYGNTAATDASSAATTLDEGLWLTQWHVLHAWPTNTAEMEQLFAGLSYADRLGWGSFAQVSCSSSCNEFGDSDYYATLFEGWLVAPASGSYLFATDSDDASDIHLGGTGWKSGIGGTNVVGWYGGHGPSNNWSHSAAIQLGAGLHRFQYRHEEVQGGDVWRAGWQPPGAASAELIPSSSLLHRKRVDEAIEVALESEQRIGTCASKGERLELFAYPGGFAVQLDGTRLEGPLASGWNQVVVTHNGQLFQLYVNGVSVAALGMNAADMVIDSSLLIGDLRGDPHSRAASLDELRVSRGARHAAWIEAQHRSVRDQLVSYGSPEVLR